MAGKVARNYRKSLSAIRLKKGDWLDCRSSFKLSGLVGYPLGSTEWLVVTHSRIDDERAREPSRGRDIDVQ